jgi:hypothetical protein
MAILTFPSITPNANAWGIVSNTQESRSELDGTVQTLGLPGDIWTDVLTFTNVYNPDARILRAFLASLRGTAGRFWLSPPGYLRVGSATGLPLVSGASQTGSSLITDGWTASQAGTLLAGDYFQFDAELKMMTADANSNGSGQATLNFVPPIRVSPADNAPIIVTSPSCVMKLKDNQQSRWPLQPGKIYALSIAVEEALG